MIAFLAWIGAQVVAPEITQRAIYSLSKPEWRSELAKAVTADLGRRLPRRQVVKFLNDPDRWQQLVRRSSDDIAHLVEQTKSDLRIRVGLGGKRLLTQDEAEEFVAYLVSNLLVKVDPSVAVAILDYRNEQRFAALGARIDDSTDEILDRLDDTSLDFEAWLAKLPISVRKPLRTAQRQDQAKALRLLHRLTDADQTPKAAIDELYRAEPEWLRDAPVAVWEAFAEAGAAYGSASATDIAERLVGQGPVGSARWLARAAMSATQIPDLDRARAILGRAQALDSSDALVVAAAFAINNDASGMLAATKDLDLGSDPLLTNLVIYSLCVSGRIGEALAMAKPILDLEPELSGTLLLVARMHVQNVTEGESENNESELWEALDAALKVRDMRRRWRSNSAEAVAVAVYASNALEDFSRSLFIGLEAPRGEATPEEAASQEVVLMLIGASRALGDLELGQELVTRLSDPLIQALTSGELLRAQGDSESAIVEFHRALGLAKDSGQRLGAQLALAEMGLWPLPGEDELLARDDDLAAYVLASSEQARGLHTEAIGRLRPWSRRSLRCAGLLASVYEAQGNAGSAIDTLREAADRFFEPSLLVRAASIAYEKGDLDRSNDLATEALHRLSARSPARPRLFDLILSGYQLRADWSALESHARTFLGERESTRLRWSLIGALYNQRKFPDAWDAYLRGGSPEPQSDSEALLWIDLATRFARSPELIAKILNLIEARWELEEFVARSIMCALRVTDELPTPLLERWHRGNGYLFRAVSRISFVA